MDIAQIESELEKIKERNRKVEAEKAWETSLARKLILSGSTYVLVTLVLFVMKNPAPFTNALIPTLGYFLSVQSLPFLKRRWIARRTA